MSKKNTYKKYIEKNGHIVPKEIEPEEFNPEKTYANEHPAEFQLEDVDAAIEEIQEETAPKKQYIKITKGNWFIRIGPGKGYAHIAIAHG